MIGMSFGKIRNQNTAWQASFERTMR